MHYAKILRTLMLAVAHKTSLFSMDKQMLLITIVYYFKNCLSLWILIVNSIEGNMAWLLKL